MRLSKADSERIAKAINKGSSNKIEASLVREIARDYTASHPFHQKVMVKILQLRKKRR